MTGHHLLIKALLVYYEHKGKYTYSNHVTVVTDLVLKYEWKVKIFQTIPDCYLINVRFCWLFSVCLPFQLITTLISFPVSGLLSGKNIHLASVFFLQYRGRLHRVSWFLKDRDLKVSNNRIFLSLFVWRRLTDCPNYQYMSNINCYFIDLVKFFFWNWVVIAINPHNSLLNTVLTRVWVAGLCYDICYDMIYCGNTEHLSLLHLHSNYKGTAAAASPERKSTRTFLYFGWNVND